MIARAFFLLVALFTLASSSGAEVVGEDVRHVVAPGETLTTIAQSYQLAPVHLVWANDLLEGEQPAAGRELLIPGRRVVPRFRGSGILVNLPERMLYLFRDGSLVDRWGVAVGARSFETPTGAFAVKEKVVNPTWTPPAYLNYPLRVVLGGEGNPLGDRWLGLTAAGIGIHGTNENTSIGEATTLGCIRMFPPHIRELYSLVPTGTRVEIRYETARAGRDRDGRIWWAAFPDIYHRGGRDDALYRELSRLGVSREVSPWEAEELAQAPNGVSTRLAGSPVELDGALSEDVVLRPTGLFMTAGLAARLGLTVANGVVTDGSRSLPLRFTALPLNAAPLETLEAHRLQGAVYLPVPETCEAFNLPFRWDRARKSLRLDLGEASR